MEHGNGGSFVVVIVDVNNSSWEGLPDGVGCFGDVLQSISLFCNSHRMLNRKNDSCIIAMGAKDSWVIGADGSSAEGAGAVGEVLARYSSGSCNGKFCALARCLTQAMCVINRHLLDKAGSAQCRVLVIQASEDMPESYNAVMNAIFSAQKSSVTLDALVLGPHDSAFLQQGSYITEGLYMRPPAWDRLLLCSALTSYYSMDASVRRLMKTPPLKLLDFRASCSCHGRHVEFAYMCSVCLALQCEPSEVCGTCATAIEHQ